MHTQTFIPFDDNRQQLHSSMLFSKFTSSIATAKVSQCMMNSRTRFLAMSSLHVHESRPLLQHRAPEARFSSKATTRKHDEPALNGASIGSKIYDDDSSPNVVNGDSSLFSSNTMMADLASQNKHMELPAHEFAMGCRFLHQTAMGNLSELKTMVQLVQTSSSLVNFRDYDRRTPLHIAASEGHLSICKWLVLEQEARINRSDRWGGSPLDDAKRHRHAKVFAFLRQQGAVFGSPSQANNLITAASEGDVDEVRDLLEYGNIDVNEGDYDQRTALHLAASATGEGQLQVIELLCQAGANVNAEDRWGNRPLDDAKRSGGAKTNVKYIQLLERHGATCGLSSSLSAKKASLGEDVLHDLMSKYGKVRDGELSMDWHDVKDLLVGIGEDPSAVTDDVVQKLFEVADVDKDGLISTQQFIANSDVFLGGRPARIILVVGGPGSGKGILSDRLVKECGVVHISSGDLLRDEVTQGSELGKQVEDIMKSGGLVSSAMMVTLMQKKMRAHPGKRVLLDGFPRSRENAQDLMMLCGKPELALHLSCEDTILIERILKRGKSGARADDNIDTALTRIRNYHKYHHVALDFLREENVPIVFLDCAATPEGVWEQLCAIGRLMRSAVKLPSGKNGDTFELP